MMKWLESICVSLIMVASLAFPLGVSAHPQHDYARDGAPGLGLNFRAGLAADKSVKKLNCAGCATSGHEGASVLALDLAYLWSDFQAGVSVSYSAVLFQEENVYVGGTFGWRRELLPWLEAGVVSEAGVHYIANAADEFLSHSQTDVDNVLLPYLGVRLGLDAVVFESTGLILGLWGSAQFDLMTRDITVPKSQFMGDGLIEEDYRVGGHSLALGLNLGFGF